MAAPVHPKVKAAGLVGLLVSVVVAALAIAGVTVPPEVAAAAVTLLSFLAAYFTSSPAA